ncbi:hypothetical protein Pfo_003272 [Paulownia fortunei]|nr:hypothetical protein Pfo_003272 [Paulownia fortunei]
MVGQTSFVPPPYIPLGHSDAVSGPVPPGDARPAQQHINNGPGQWSSGICACFDDIQSCCIGLFCPYYRFGKNAEVLGSGTMVGSCMTHFVLWALVNTFCCVFTEGILLGLPGCFIVCYACGYRSTIRSKYNLQYRRHQAEVFYSFLPFMCHMSRVQRNRREVWRFKYP